MFHDYGKKWKHTPAQFELNRKFAHAHNPTDDNMTTDPAIYDDYKRQVNVYGETSVYKRDYGKLVPKPVVTPKTDWCDGSVSRSGKTKQQTPHQKMTVVSAPPRPGGGCDGPHPPASVPIVTADIVP